MARGNRSGETNRRQFLSGAGAALTFGAVGRLTACANPATVLAAEKRSIGRIEHDALLCAGCGVCTLMCSLYHEKEIRVALSRSELVRDPFEGANSLNTCRQCLSPSCHRACPQKDSALCVDPITGIKYVNAENCKGCGICARNCPLQPVRIKINPAKKTAYKCDLCRGREKGPICIEYCAQHALTVVQESAEG